MPLATPNKGGTVNVNRRLLFILAAVAAAASVAAIALAASGPQTTGLRGHATLRYRKPFTRCTGGDGSAYRQVLNWVGRGTVHSKAPGLDGQKIVDNVNFFQNVDTGVGTVVGTVRTKNAGRRTGAGTLAGVWQGNNGRGQIVIHPVGGSPLELAILNVGLHLRKVSKGFAVRVVFGGSSSRAPANVSAFFNGQTCP